MIAGLNSELREMQGARLEIDLAAICSNYRLLRERLNGVACGAVVKADAYGLGALPIVTALAQQGCRHFFVAYLDEGLALRPQLPQGTDIIILNGLPRGAERDCAASGLVPVLNSLDQIEAWAGCARELDRRLPAVVQLDSGMARLGLTAREVEELADSRLCDTIDLKLIMTHLACADEPHNPANRAQLATFQALLKYLPAAPVSLANSSGIFLGADFHGDLARPGAALYGINPTPGAANPMRPVVRLSARVIQTRRISAGDAVGYGWSFKAGRAMRLATLSIGYADGCHRVVGNVGRVYAGEIALPVVGRVSMDSMTVDISALSEAALAAGDLVDLVGPCQSIDDFAVAAGTIGYEVLTGLGPRLQRVYVGHASSYRPLGELKEMSS
jgi:alanine racemase